MHLSLTSLRRPEVPEGGAANGAGMSWPSRLFFFVVAVLASGALLAGVGCTRRGKVTTLPPTTPPITTYYVNPATGSDSTGNGTSTKPFKTLTKTLSVVKGVTTPDLTIQLAPGNYTTSIGEVFPIVIPVGVAISGTASAGGGYAGGSYIDGWGEDTNLEKLAHKPAGSDFATLVVPQTTSGASANNIYVGTTKVAAIPTAGQYAAIDVMGSMTISSSTFFSGVAGGRKLSGIVVPSGSFTCTGCTINGTIRAIGAFSIPGASAPPSVTLSGAQGQSKINGFTGIQTDGTANLTVSNQTFQARTVAFSDGLAQLVTPVPSSSPIPPVVDFGYNANNTGAQSTGGNTLLGASTTELFVTRSSTYIVALGNTWNPTQGANRFGQYQVNKIFLSNTPPPGQNVTITKTATYGQVEVGPVPPPTIAPSATPSASPTPTPTPAI
jgi:hypothetical protein